MKRRHQTSSGIRDSAKSFLETDSSGRPLNQYDKEKKIEQKYNKEKFERSKSNEKNEKQRMTNDNINGKHDKYKIGISQTFSNISTESGGITYQIEKGNNTNDPSIELEVLKCILLRESHIRNLLKIVNNKNLKTEYSKIEELSSKLDLLRITTIEVVENIIKWRNAQIKPSRFMWNGLDYLLKISSDLDFLNKEKYLIDWLGFTLERNPFIVPNNFDIFESDYSNPSNGSDNFTVIGGYLKSNNASVDPIRTKLRHTDIDNSSVHSAPVAPTAYSTPIINDGELLPKRKSFVGMIPTKAKMDQLSSIKGVHPSLAWRADGNDKSPFISSKIDSSDMKRIREAKKFILMEEEILGKYKRDPYGRLVPELKAIQIEKEIEITGESIDEKHEREKRLKFENLFSESAGEITNINENQNIGKPLVSSPSGKQKGHKYGGILHPITKISTNGKKKSPTKRSRGARIEENLEISKRNNNTMQKEIDVLRNNINEAEIEYKILLSSIEESSSSGDSILYEYAKDVSYQNQINEEIINIKKDMMLKINTLQEELSTKEKILQERQEIAKNKEESIQLFKKIQKQEIDDIRKTELERKRNLLSNGEVLLEDEFVSRSVENQSVTTIQKRIRGIQAREYVKKKKKIYHTSSISIQAGGRGYITRKKIKTKKKLHKSAIIIQKYIRGMFARKILKAKKLYKKRNVNATKIQKIIRGKYGRNRMIHYRLFIQSHIKMRDASISLFPSDINNLIENCRFKDHTSTPPSVLLGLIHIIKKLIVFPLDKEDEGDSNIRFGWHEAVYFLSRHLKILRRLNFISGIAGKLLLFIPKEGCKLANVYTSEPSFNFVTFNSLKTRESSKVATCLFQWMIGFLVIIKLQDKFISKEKQLTISTAIKNFDYYNENLEDINNDILENEKCILNEKEIKKMFISPIMMKESTPSRSCPIILALARDIPEYSKNKILLTINNILPGLFIRINKPEKDINLDIIRKAIYSGHSVIIDVDIGLSCTQRRIFTSQFTSIKNSLQKYKTKVPNFILVHGYIKNRSGEYLLKKSKFFGVSKNDLDHMKDKDLKEKFEIESEIIYYLNSKSSKKEMIQLSMVDSPNKEIMTLMEVLLIILSSDKIYSGPGSIHSVVVWNIARKLLENPDILLSKMEEIEYDIIPFNTIEILLLYISDTNIWPNESKRHGKGANLFVSLCLWIETIIKIAEMIRCKGGLAPKFLKNKNKNNCIFSSIILVTDNIEINHNNMTELDENENVGWKLAINNIFFSILRDVRVFRKILKLPKSNTIGININESFSYYIIDICRDCRKFIFFLYDPFYSIKRMSTIEEQDINFLLSPNLFESLVPNKNKSPPTKPKEMYNRLINLCKLENIKKKRNNNRNNSNINNINNMVLSVSRNKIKLLRIARKVFSYHTIMTIYESGENQLFIDVYLTSLSCYYYLIINEKLFYDLYMDATDGEDIIYNINNINDINKEKMIHFLIDRITIYQRKKTKLYVSKQLNNIFKYNKNIYKNDIMIKIRQKGGAGTIIYRKIINKKTWFKKWIVTIFEIEHNSKGLHKDKNLRVQFYDILTSNKIILNISSRERNYLLLKDHYLYKNLISRIRFYIDNKHKFIKVRLDRRILKKFIILYSESEDSIGISEENHLLCMKYSTCIVEVYTGSGFHGGLIFYIYFPFTSSKYCIYLSDTTINNFIQNNNNIIEKDIYPSYNIIKRNKQIYTIIYYFRWNKQLNNIILLGTKLCFINCTNEKYKMEEEKLYNENRYIIEKKIEKYKENEIEIEYENENENLSLLETKSEISTDNKQKKEKEIAIDLLFKNLNRSEYLFNDPNVNENSILLLDKDILIYKRSFRIKCIIYSYENTNYEKLKKEEIFNLFHVSFYIKFYKKEINEKINSSVNNTSFNIKIIVYDPTKSVKSYSNIEGIDDLKEVLGTKYINYEINTTNSNIDYIFSHIIMLRTQIVYDGYNIKDNLPYLITFIKDRIYKYSKITPINVNIDKDKDKNDKKLINDNNIKRGIKIISKAFDISNKIMILTAFDLTIDNQNDILSYPIIRIFAYSQETSKTFEIIIRGALLLEIIADSIELLEKTKRKELAIYLMKKLILKKRKNDEELVFPYISTSESNESNVQVNNRDGNENQVKSVDKEEKTKLLLEEKFQKKKNKYRKKMTSG